MSEHLWEYDHPYYCNRDNYYSADCYQEFASWSAFMGEYGDADLDYNLVFRWDWIKASPENEQEYDMLYIFVMQQRKGRFVPIGLRIEDDKEPEVRDWLMKRKAHLDRLWNPIDVF